ncbi:MAG: site-specific integrase [Nitrososphaerales archaeon]
MPLVKSQRLLSAVISPSEFQEILAKLPKELDAIKGEYSYVNKKDGQRVGEKFNIPIAPIRVILIIAYLFGRRIEEILLLKRGDVRWMERDVPDPSDLEKTQRRAYLVIDFFALKRKDSLKVKRPKLIPLTNRYSKEVLEYCSRFSDPDSYLFPGGTEGKRVRRVVAKNPDGSIRIGKKGINQGKELVYFYPYKLKGTMSVERVWKCLKFVAPDLWLHLFRHTAATLIANRTGDPYLMRDWLDWTTIAPGDRYVRSSEERARRAGDLRELE